MGSKLTNEQILKHVQSKQLKTNIPKFRSGDTIIVHNKIIENNKSRIQKFEGVVISRRGSLLSETFIVRKESSGVGVERIFQLHSPQIEKIEVIRLGKVRRDKLFYLRNVSGKSARIKERKPKGEYVLTTSSSSKKKSKKEPKDIKNNI